jgi:hypothetical protein
MKKYILNAVFLAFLAIGLTACFENPAKIYDGPSVVEFDAAVTTAPAAGRTYPLVTVANGAGKIKTRINLVGPQRPNAESIKVVVDTQNSTAVAGTHYRLTSETVSIPANTSFGELEIEILSVPAEAGKTVTLVLMLEGNGTEIKASENFKRLGWNIRL